MSFTTPFQLVTTSSGQSPAQRESENAVTSEKLTIKQTSTMIFFKSWHKKANSFLEKSLPLLKSKDSQSHKYSIMFVAIIVITCYY